MSTSGRRGRRWLLAMVAVAGVLIASRVDAISGPHNFQGTAPAGAVCIACHTPHKAPASPLLWNHVLSANNFSWSDWVATTGNTTLPTNIKTWSGSTKMCLSCHDGSVAIGAIYFPSAVFDLEKITDDHQMATTTGDLKGNHPVAVPYPHGGVKNTYNGITTGDEALASGWVAAPARVKLYRDAAGGGANNYGIECASCHEPHSTSPHGNYLRDSKAGSALCLDCHVK